MPVAWVTGASSGLGLHTAEALSALGWQVVGGARSFETDGGPGFAKLPLDVSKPDSVAAFREEALKRFGLPDALVNAAGIVLLGACEDCSDEELLGVLQTNLLGALRMVRCVLPLMRERGGGRIVNFSSVNGLLAIPFQGAYSMSKHALEGFSEALMMETASHGVQVMLVEPGDHRGGQMKYRGRTAGQSPVYRAAFDRVCARIAADEASGGEPGRLGRRVAQAISKKRLPARLKVVKFPERMAIILHDLLPTGLFTRLLALYYGAGRKN